MRIVPSKLIFDFLGRPRYNLHMYLRTKTSKLSPRKTVQIVESYINENAQRRQRIVQHLGVACDDEQLQKLWEQGEKLIPQLEEQAKQEKLFKEGQLPLFSTTEMEYERELSEEETVRIKKLIKKEDTLEGPFEVWSEVFDKLGMEGLFGLSDRGRGATNTLKLCLTAKLTDGGSKDRASMWLKESLGIYVSSDRIYRMMDKLAKRTQEVKDLGFQIGKYLCGNRISMVLFDVTTLYFESFMDDEAVEGSDGSGLRRHGFSKDCKFKETQVVLALACSPDGIPLWYELFPGNRAECSTLKEMIASVSSKVSPEELVVVADGAMLTKENRSMLEEHDAGYVLGASIKKLPKGIREEALDVSKFVELEEGRKYRTVVLENGNTLVVTWSADKAKKDACDRDGQIKKLLKQLNAKGEISGKTAIGNRGKSKYIEPTSGQDARYRLNEAKIEEEVRYDGLHAVETDRVVQTEEDVRFVLGAYGNLWHIEDCFRVSKSDLKIRPIYHWTESRIRAHVAICFLALLMERYLEVQLLNRRSIRLSAQRIKDALLRVNSTLIKDTTTDKLYRFPSPIPKDAREIYKALGLKRGLEPKEITSMVNYRRRIPNLAGEVDESDG